MDLSHRLAISYYKTIAAINEKHHIYLVQHPTSNRIFVKKILDVYNIDVYNKLYSNPISGTPRIIDYCEDDNKLLLIEEYISGTPLSDKIINHDINEQDILTYTLDLCNILEKLHALNPPLIHRDIKPSNIIITNYNHAVLLDFNAAKQFASGKCEDTVLLGTQGYAAPEQYGFGSSTPQTDIYSLGMVFKEMIGAGNITSEKLNHIVETCTQLNPKERYSSIKELKNEILLLLKQPDKQSLRTKSLSRFLPPGYRTHTPWKMLFSSIVYLLVFTLCLSLEVKNVYGPALWVERIICLAMMLSVIFGCFNYLNIQRIFPICQHKNRLIRYFGICLLNISIVFLLFIILFLIETLFFHNV